jgi:hypothetical protein
MSTLVTANLTSPGGQGGAIQVTPDTKLAGAAAGAFVAPGMIIQTSFIQIHANSTWSSPPTGNGTTVTALNLTITPKRANSIIYCEWIISGEIQHDNVWLIHKNGSLAGYNLDAGNSRWAGWSTCLYDADDSTTPAPVHMFFWDTPGSTASVTYAPAIRCSNGNTYTFALNRPLNSTGTSGQENGVSTGVIMEIAQ